MWINQGTAVATAAHAPAGAAVAAVQARADGAAPPRCRKGAAGWSSLHWRWLWAWPFPLAVLALWQLSAVNGWVPDQVLPPPGVVFATFADMAASGELWSNLSISLCGCFPALALA